MGLMITRKRGEDVYISDGSGSAIKIVVLRISASEYEDGEGRVLLLIKAPRRMQILRGELLADG